MITGTGNHESVSEESPAVGISEATEASSSERESKESGAELPLDVVFDILKNRRRRLVIRYLSEVTATSTLSDLAEHIASLENDKPESALTSSERKRVYVCLYQCHLPKMDDAGIVDFEKNRGTVVLADDTEQFTQYLDTGDEAPDPDWPKYYVILAVLGGGVFIVQQFLYPGDVVSGAIIGVILVLYANLALEHAFQFGLIPQLRPRPKRPVTPDSN